MTKLQLDYITVCELGISPMKDENFDNYHAQKLIESLTSIIESRDIDDSVVHYVFHTLKFIPWNEGISDSWIELLKLLDGQLKQSSENPQKQLEEYITTLEDPFKSFEGLEILITNYFKNNQFEDALVFVNKQIEIAEETNTKHLKSRSYQTKGVLYHVLGQLKKAEEWYVKSYQFIEEIQSDQLKDRIIYSLANLYQHYIGNFEKASEYYEIGHQLAITTENKEREGFYLDHLGMANFYLKNYEKAINYHDKAWNIIESQERSVNVLFHKVQLSQALSKIQEYERMGNELLSVLDLNKKNPDPFSNCLFLLLLSEYVEIKPNNFKDLKNEFANGLDIEIDPVTLSKAAKDLAYKTKHVPSMVNSNIYLAKYNMENDPANAMALLSEAKQLAIQNNRKREEMNVKEFANSIGLDYDTL